MKNTSRLGNRRTFRRATLLLQVILFVVYLAALAYTGRKVFNLSDDGFVGSFGMVVGVLLAPYFFTLFVPLVLLSTPLYVLCARTLHGDRRSRSVGIAIVSAILVATVGAAEYLFHFSAGGFSAVLGVLDGLNVAERRPDSRMVSVAICAAIVLSPVFMRCAFGMLGTCGDSGESQ